MGEASLAAKEQALKEKDALIAKQNEKIENLQQDLDKSRKEIEELETAKQALSKELNACKTTLAEREDEIAKQNEKLAALQKQMEENEADWQNTLSEQKEMN